MAVHTYSPFAWAHNGEGQYTGAAGIRDDLNRVAAHAQRLGTAVILSEWGSINNGRPENTEQRVQHAYDYVSIARSLGMATFWWDNNQWTANNQGEYVHTFGLFNRATDTVLYSGIIDAIIRGMQTETVGLPTEPEFTLRLIGYDGNNWWPQYIGERTPINGNGTFTVTAHAQGAAQIISLTVTNDEVDIPARFENARVNIDSVTINGSAIGLTQNTGIALVSQHWQSGENEVNFPLWNMAYTRRMTDGVVSVGEQNFGLPGNAPINEISVTFTLSGVSACTACNQNVCVCGETQTPDPEPVITRRTEMQVCEHCGVEKAVVITTLTVGDETVEQRFAAKRSSAGVLLGGSCVHSKRIVNIR
jgi:hypothetical protein